MDRRSLIILKRGLRNDPVYRAPKVLGLATRRDVLRGVSAGALCAALSRSAKAGIGAIGGTWGSVGTGQAGFYPAGHWVAAKFPFTTSNQTATQIYPRPDTETNAYAFHRHIFYDGATSFQTRIPIIARGGSYPFVDQIIQAPAAAGASLPATYWQANWTIAQALAAGYGDLLLNPTGTFSAGTFQIRRWGQDGNYIDFIFTSSTLAGYDATNGFGFVFLDPVNGVDPGSYPVSGVSNNVGSPIKTLPWAFGATQGATTYPNAFLVCRTGTVPLFAPDSTYGIKPTPNKGPIGAINFPGETVNFDITNSGSRMAFDMPTGSDQLFQGTGFTGTPTNQATDYSYFFAVAGQVQTRLVLQNISIPNIWCGTGPVGSGASILTLDDPNSSASTPLHTYVAMKGCSETNRNKGSGGGGTNSTSIITGYKSQYVCVELCTATGATCNYGFRPKLINMDWTIQAFETDGTVNFLCGSSDFNGGSVLVSSQNIEYRYGTISTTSTNSTPTFYFDQAAQSNLGSHYAYRLTINGCAGAYPPGSPGPLEFQNNAVQFGSHPQAILSNTGSGWVGGALPSGITNDGTSNGTSTCQASSGVLDVNNLLTGTYRTNYLGQYGAEIA